MNSMPFRQLKSFFKILIGVQYHCIAIHPGMPAEYPQKRQSLRLHRCFRCGWPLMCGRQDSIILRCEFRRAEIQQLSTGLLHLHGFKSAAISGAGDRTRVHYGAPGGNAGWQQSTGLLHLHGFESCRFFRTKKESPRGGSLFWCGRQDSNLHS